MAKEMAADRAFVDRSLSVFDTEVPLDAMSPAERAGAYSETSGGTRKISAIQAMDPRVKAVIDEDLRAEGESSGKPVTDAARLERYVSVYEPRAQALERIGEAPEAAWHRAIGALKARGGDYRNPIEIESEMQRQRDEDQRANMSRRQEASFRVQRPDANPAERMLQGPRTPTPTFDEIRRRYGGGQ